MRSISKHGAPVALAALVALVVHQLAYLVAFPVAAVRADRLVDHGHLTTQWALVTPLAVLTASAFIVHQARRLGLGGDLDARRLAIIGGVMFIGQEAAEAALQGGGLDAVLTNPAAWIGVLITPLVAAAIVRTLTRASELVSRFFTVPTVVTPVEPPTPRPTSDPAITVEIIGASSPRGPPRLLRS